EHDHAADALGDPRIELVDLSVELVVRVALEQLVTALRGFLLRALEEQRVDARRRVRLREGDRLRVRDAGEAGERRPREREPGGRTRGTEDEPAPVDRAGHELLELV